MCSDKKKYISMLNMEQKYSTPSRISPSANRSEGWGCERSLQIKAKCEPTRSPTFRRRTRTGSEKSCQPVALRWGRLLLQLLDFCGSALILTWCLYTSSSVWIMGLVFFFFGNFLLFGPTELSRTGQLLCPFSYYWCLKHGSPILPPLALVVSENDIAVRLKGTRLELRRLMGSYFMRSLSLSL